MRIDFTFQKKCILLVLFIIQLGWVQAQRKMEKLDRGLVAVKVSNGVFLSWRVLGTDPKDISFNIYKDGTKVNNAPITGATNLIDPSGSTTSSYTVKPVIGGDEQAAGKPALPWSSQVKTISLNRPGAIYQPNDCSVGDLDGDGEYEIIIKWYPDNAKDNSQSGVTDKTFLDAYKLDGTFMWRIDLGINIRSGAHYTQFLVGDYNSDGLAEVACKTAPGTKDGTGAFLKLGPAASDNDASDYRNDGGYILTGPEYLTIFNGKTGAEMATVNYLVPRGNVGSWEDNYGNRVDRFNATNAYLDGVKPSMIFQRGYYTRMVIAAFDWDGNTLSNRWLFDSNNPGSENAFGQGNHSIMTADVDDDGFDEILTGSCAIDHDGKFMWATGFGHGDANHVGDFDPDSPGLEVWQVSENKGTEPDHYMIRAKDGHILWRNGSGNDNGRGMVGDIDDRYPGQEAWSNSVAGTFRANGTSASTVKPSSANFRVYWDGDLQDELLSDKMIDKWNGSGTTRLLTLTGNSANGTKATPNLTADILGDWREEVILHDGGSNIYIHTTTIPTEHKLYTLMHDPVYRNAISWQQSSYNQPPHLGFFLGAGIDKIPTPDIVLVGGTDCNNVAGGTAYIDGCGVCVAGNTGKEACVVDCNGDENGTAEIDECGVCTGGDSPYFACTGNLEAEEACNVNGILLETTNQGYSGNGYVNSDNAIGSKIAWVLNSSQDQTATISFRYANGGSSARNGNLIVNTSPAKVLNLPATGAWNSWQVATVNVDMKSGQNTITLEAVTAEGLANIDLLSFSDGVSQSDCSLTAINTPDDMNVKVHPNPTQNKASWGENKTWTLLNSHGQIMNRGEGTNVDLSVFPNGIYFLKIGNHAIKVIKE